EDVNNTILATLTLQRDFIRRQISAEERRGTTEHERLKALMEGIAAEISQLEAQATLQTERLKLSEGFVTSAMQLAAKGAMPRFGIQAARAGHARAAAEPRRAAPASRGATKSANRDSLYPGAASGRA